VATAGDLLEQGKIPSQLDRLDALTPALILAAAGKGDELARQAIKEVGADLGIMMSICAAVLNPGRFIVGGGLGLAAFDLLTPPSILELERRVTRFSIEQLAIVPSRLASSAVGAACQVWERS
jgi:glucokinase